MKVKIEMDLADLLRISVLLDHHRIASAEAADATTEPVSQIYKGWDREAGELNKRLLAAVTRRSRP